NGRTARCDKLRQRFVRVWRRRRKMSSGRRWLLPSLAARQPQVHASRDRPALNLLSVSQSLRRRPGAYHHQEAESPHGDPQVEPQRGIADVPLVHLFLFFFGYELRSVYLRPPTDARPYQKSNGRVRGLILGEEGSRSDQRHVANQNVQQLRQLIDPGGAKEA